MIFPHISILQPASNSLEEPTPPPTSPGEAFWALLRVVRRQMHESETERRRQSETERRQSEAERRQRVSRRAAS